MQCVCFPCTLLLCPGSSFLPCSCSTIKSCKIFIYGNFERTYNGLCPISIPSSANIVSPSTVSNELPTNRRHMLQLSNTGISHAVALSQRGQATPAPGRSEELLARVRRHRATHSRMKTWSQHLLGVAQRRPPFNSRIPLLATLLTRLSPTILKRGR